MTPTTKWFGNSSCPDASKFNLALNTSLTFREIYQEAPKLDRQWCACLEDVAAVHLNLGYGGMAALLLPEDAHRNFNPNLTCLYNIGSIEDEER
jgi:hypothetical protein